MTNGQKCYDTQGNEIHAHGGGIITVGDYYYWYGEDRRGNNYVSCYRSKDLENWEFRNVILSTKSRISSFEYASSAYLRHKFTGKKINTERPKVLYCEKTKEYIMWAHFENGMNYKVASACVATCDTPDGDFVFRGEFRPFGNMSRDCTLYYEDGKAFFVSASNDNKDLKIYLLSDDFLNVKKEVATIFSGDTREAPTLLKKNGLYYLFTSACTGWAPNQGKYAVSQSLTAGWSELKDFGDETTFLSQPTWVIEKDGKYIYLGDRWGGDGKKYLESTYVFLNIDFDNDIPSISYTDNPFRKDC